MHNIVSFRFFLILFIIYDPHDNADIYRVQIIYMFNVSLYEIENGQKYGRIYNDNGLATQFVDAVLLFSWGFCLVIEFSSLNG